MNDFNQEENLRRLIGSSLNGNARPAAEIRQRTLQNLRQQLRAAGRPTERQAATEVTFDPETSRIRSAQNQKKSENQKDTIMKKLYARWRFGLTAAAGAGAFALILVLATPKEAQGKAVTVMTRAAQAVTRLTTVHYTAKLRTDPRDNFSFIAPNHNFLTVEFWKQFGPELKWRVDKPGRIAVMDGKSSVLFIKPDYALKGPPSSSAFDTQLFQELAGISDTLMNELSAIKAHGWLVTLAEERGADGKAKSIITVQAKSGLPDSDYLKNKFFMTADTRRVYIFDNESELLEGVKIYTGGGGGDELVFELSRIDYNQPIDPSVFELQLPAGVSWDQGMKMVADNAKYAAMTSEEAARAFFEACGNEDWAEVEKFCTFANNDRFKQYLGGVKIVNLGKAFGSAANGAQFVPYELNLKDGMIKKHNLALKKDPSTGRWFVDGGI
jgi:outer membrane lipoprotein-sorting protein